jgi:uncharacterized protein (DUF983 family)
MKLSEVDVCLDCPCDSSRRRHLAKVERCEACGVDGPEPTGDDEPLATVTPIRTGLADSIRRHPSGRDR